MESVSAPPPIAHPRVATYDTCGLVSYVLIIIYPFYLTSSSGNAFTAAEL